MTTFNTIGILQNDLLAHKPVWGKGHLAARYLI